MSQSILEIAKEITIEAIKQGSIILPETNSFEQITEFNQKRADEIAKFYKTIVVAVNDAFNNTSGGHYL